MTNTTTPGQPLGLGLNDQLGLALARRIEAERQVNRARHGAQEQR